MASSHTARQGLIRVAFNLYYATYVSTCIDETVEHVYIDKRTCLHRQENINAICSVHRKDGFMKETI